MREAFDRRVHDYRPEREPLPTFDPEEHTVWAEGPVGPNGNVPSHWQPMWPYLGGPR